jgi:hypothetical protein
LTTEGARSLRAWAQPKYPTYRITAAKVAAWRNFSIWINPYITFFMVFLRGHPDVIVLIDQNAIVFSIDFNSLLPVSVNQFLSSNLSGVTKYTQKLMDEQAQQFEVQTEIFAALGVENPKMRSLYFSSTLQGLMLMYSTYPQSFPLDAVKAQAIAEFCQTED